MYTITPVKIKNTAIKYLGLGSIAIGTTAKNTATPMMNSGIKIGTCEMNIFYVKSVNSGAHIITLYGLCAFGFVLLSMRRATIAPP
jgi:hypothetical protein